MAFPEQEFGNFSNTSGSTIAATVPAAGVAVDRHLLIAVANGGTITLSSVTDSKGNTYQIDVARTGAAAWQVSLVSAKITTALVSGDTITATLSAAATKRSIQVAEAADLAATSWLDQTAGPANGNSQNPDSGLTATTTQADERIYGAVAMLGTSPMSWTPGSGHTLLSGQTNIDRELKPEFKDVSATGTYKAEFSTTAAADVWYAAVATYKLAAAGTPKSTADTGTGTDAIASLEIPVSDTASGTDAVELISADMFVDDTGVGTDTPVLTQADYTIDDAGVGTDTAGYQTDVGPITDTGTGTDLVDAIVSSLFTLTIAGVNRGPDLEWEGFEVEEADGIARCHFTVIDPTRTITVAQEAEVLVDFQGVRVFGGFVREVDERVRGPSRFYDVVCQDYNTLLDDDVIPHPTYRSASESDKARVEWLLTFGTRGITGGSLVVQTMASMPGGTDARPEQDFGGKTMRQAIAQIAKITGARFYVDALKRLHYFLDIENVAAPFGLSDTPNYSTTYPHYALVRPRNSAEFKNAVYIRGKAIQGWYPASPPSPRRAGAVIDEEIETQAQLDAVGAAFLEAHTQRSGLSCQVLQPGLHPGVLVPVTSTHYGLSAVNHYLAKVTTRLQSRTRALFDLQLGDRIPELGTLIGDFRSQLPTQAGERGQVATELLLDQPGATNLIPDSTFEAPTAARWTVGTGWTHGHDPTGGEEAYHGSKVARLVRSAATAGDLYPLDYITVNRKRDYVFSVWSFLRSRSAGTARLEVREYNAANTLLATTVIVDLTAAETEWKRHTIAFGDFETQRRRGWQTTTAKVRLVANSAAANATLTWDVDGWQIEPGNRLTGYAPSPDELWSTTGYVSIGPEGVTIVNGALTVKNPGGTVIIDGTSDMFRIVASGTITISAGPAGGYSPRIGDGVHVSHNASQTVTSGVQKVLAMNTERFDDAGFHSTSSNTSRLTVPTGWDGTYFAMGCARWSNIAAGSMSISIFKNGTTQLASTYETAAAGGDIKIQVVAATVKLAAGDYLELVADQNSGGNETIDQVSQYSPEFQMVLLRPTAGSSSKVTNTASIATSLTYAPTFQGFVEGDPTYALGLPLDNIDFTGNTIGTKGVPMDSYWMTTNDVGANTVVTVNWWSSLNRTASALTFRWYLQEQIAF